MQALTKDQLLNLLNSAGAVSPVVRAECEAMLTVCETNLIGKYPTIERPTIKYDLKGHTAGQARYSKNININVIRLNAQLLADPAYHDDMVNNTLPHEYAHIVVMQLWPKEAAHGNVWRSVARDLGIKPTTCHDYDTKPARVHDKYTVYCHGCGKVYKIGAAVKRRLQNNQRRYYCRVCKSPLEYESWRNAH